MNALPVNVAVVDKNTVVEAEALRTTQQGKTVKVKAVANGKYILAEGEKGVAPENITVKRVGKNLWVILEGGDLQNPDLIIKDFYAYNGELVGKGEDGAFHNYIASDAQDDHEAAALIEGDASALVLGADQIAGLENLIIAQNGMINPMLLGLGLLSALGAAVGVAYHNNKKNHENGGSGSDDDHTPLLPDPGDSGSLLLSSIDTVSDNVGDIQGPISKGGYTDDTTPTLSGSGSVPGHTVEIWDNGVKIGEAVVNKDRTWTFTPSSPLSEGDHSFTVIERDEKGNKGQPSDNFDVIVDTKAPAQATLDTVYDDHGTITGPLAEGAATDDNTPTLSGKAEPHSTVSIFDNGKKIGEALTDANGNWTFTPATPLADGKHSFTVVAVDRAGNVGLPSDPHSIIIDTQAPDNPGIGDIIDNVGPVTGPVDNGGSTDDNQPTIGGGGATPGDVVTIIDDGKPIGSTVVDDDGNWTFKPEIPLEDGEHNIGIIITDPVGNPSEPSDDYKIIVDTQAPDKPVITAVIDNQGDKQGALNPGETTDDAHPAIQGRAEANSVVKLYDNGVLIGSTLTNAEGNWTFTPSKPLTNGGHSLTAEAVDKAGNISEPSDPFDFNLSTGGIPSAPAIIGVIDDVGDVQGNVAKGGVTDDTRPTVHGTSQPGTTISVYDNGVLLGTALTGEDGKWSFTPETDMTEGKHSLTVTATDASGKVSPATGEYPIVIDITAPENEGDTTLTDDVGPVQGPIKSGDTTDDATPTFSGKTEPGAVIIVRDNGEEIGSAVADKDGKWSFTPDKPLADGDHSFTAQPVDKAGNKGAESKPVDFVVDTSATIITITNVWDDEGEPGYVQKGGVTNDTTPTVNGTATPGAIVKVYDNGKLIGSVTANYKGEWAFTPATPLAEGPHSFTATATTPAQGESAPTAPFDLIIDITAPANGGIEDVIDDVGSVQGPVENGGVTDDSTPTLIGEGEPGDIVTIIDNGDTIGTAIVGDDGKWTFTPETPLNDGKHEFETVITDPAGNKSEPSPPYSVIVDTTPPEKPEIGDIIDDVGPVTGPIDNGGSTDDNQPTIGGGGATPGDVVTIIDDGKPIGSTVVDEDGNWTYKPEQPLPDGEHNIGIIITDPAGNDSEPSDDYKIIIDTQAPDKPVITEVIDNQGDKQGAISPGDTTDDAQPTVRGKAEANSLVNIYDNGQLIGSARTNAGGEWEFTPSKPLSNGVHSLTAEAVDAAGNVSEPSDKFDFNLAAGGAPTAPAITGVFDDVGDIQGNVAKGGVTDDTRPTVQGTAQPGSIVTVFADGKVLGTTKADANGNWSFTPANDLAEGLRNLSASATDAIGNTSPQTGLYPIIIDTTPPVASIDDELTDNVGPVQGPIKSGDTTDDAQPTFSGKTEPGAVIIVRDNGKELGSAVADKDGNWSFTPDQPLQDGEHSFTAQPVDKAGNKGPESQPIDFIIDTSDVLVSITHVVDDAGSVTGNLTNGAVSDDTTPTIKGSSTPNALIHIYDNGTLIGSVKANYKGEWSFTPEVALAEGEHRFTATATNDAGTSAQSAPFDLTIDLTAPTNGGIDDVLDDVGSVQGPVDNGGVTDDTTPTLVGEGEPGDVVTIIDNGDTIGTAIVGDDGKWTFTPETPLNDGKHEFETVITDPAGNKSEPSDPYIVIVDTQAPNKPLITEVFDDQGDSKGPLKSGDITDDSIPKVKGTAEANSLIKIYDNGQLIGSARTDANGNWSFEPSKPLINGPHSLKVEAVDAAGNVSEPSDNFDFTLAAGGASTAPAITNVMDDVGDIQGPVQKGGVTDDSRPTVIGTAQPGSIITVYSNGKALGTTLADAKGNWSFTPVSDLADGYHKLTATAKDTAGNISPETGIYSIEVDTKAPNAILNPELIDDVGAIQGPIKNGDTTDDSNPTFSGKTEPGAVVVVRDNGQPIGSTVADQNGNWSFTPVTPLADGEHSFTAQPVDQAGNKGSETAPIDFVVDTSNVVIAITQVIDDAGAIKGDLTSGQVTDDTTPTIKGIATANAIVKIYDNGKLIGSTLAAKDGSWTFTPSLPLSEGMHNLTATATTPAHGESAATAPFNLIIDVTAPTYGGIDDVLDDVGAVQGPIGNGGTTDDTTPTLIGGGMPGDVVTIIDNGQTIGSTVIDDKGKWTFTPETPLNDGKHEFETVITDPAGNAGKPSDPYVVIIDTEAPNKPVITEVFDDQGDRTGPVNPGDIIDDSIPTIKGTAEANSLVKIYDNGILLGSTRTDANGNWTFEPRTALANGTHSLTAESVDDAGNISEPSDKFDFGVISGGTPSAPAIISVVDDVGDIQGPIQKGGLTDDARPTVNGTAQPGSIVTVYADGKTLGSTLVDKDGNWSFTPDTDLADGVHRLTATAVNPAGNVSPETGVYPIEVDTTPPVAIIAPWLMDDVGQVQGPIFSGDTTDDSQPTFNGEAEPGATVIVRDNGQIIGSTIADKDGNWSFTPDQPLVDGDHSFTAQPIDKAGNKGPESEPVDFVLDTADVVIAITQVVDDVGSVTGNLTSGQSTDDTTPTIKGIATGNAIVKIYDNGQIIGSTVAAKDGSWTFTPSAPLSEGPHKITATATTPSQGESEPTSPFNLVIDTTPPDNGGIDDVRDDVGTDQGSVENGGSTDDTTPTLIGGGIPGDVVTIIDNGQPIGTTKVDENGKWTFTPGTPLNDGKHEFETIVTDPAGNASKPSDPYVVIIDTQAPGKPVITEVYDDQGDRTGPLNPGDETDDSVPTVKGTAEANSLVKIYDNGVLIGSTRTDANGKWTFEPPRALTNGPHSLTAEAVDAAGNVSDPSSKFDFSVAAGSAPVAPAITNVIDDVGDTQGAIQKGGLTDDARPTINGTAQPGNVVTIYDNGTVLGTTLADANGNWSFTPSSDLADGIHKLAADATDKAGNVSPKTGEFPIEVDTTPPAAILNPELTDDVGAVQGPILSGDTTDDSNPTFTGKTEPGATVIVRDNGRPIGSTIADKDGNWTYTPTSPLDDGKHSFTAQPVDRAGNKGPESEPIDFIVDTSGLVIAITRVVDDVGSVVGNLTSGQATDDTTPTLFGTATPNALVKIYDNGQLIGQVTANAQGEWTFTPTTPLTEGLHSFTATATDETNGESAPTPKFDINIDLTAPNKGVIDTVNDDVGTIQGPIAKGGYTDDNTPTLEGRGTSGDTVTIIDNGQPIGTAIVGADGKWNFTPTTPLNDGEHEFTVVMTDPAGNSAVPSEPYKVIIDTQAPNVPTITRVVDDVGSIVGDIPRNGSTDDKRPTLHGTAEAGSLVTVIMDNNIFGSVYAAADGSWSFTPGSDLADGKHEFSVTSSDAAGNQSPQAPVWPISIQPDQITTRALISDMGKDSGSSGTDWLTNDGSAGRLINGTLTSALLAGEIVQVSTDGGKTWQAALSDGLNWSLIDAASHIGNWQIQSRVVNGNLAGDVTTQQVTLDTVAPSTPTSATRNGNNIDVAFDKTAVAGDTISVTIGGYNFDYTLTVANILAKKVSLPIPSDILSKVGTSNDYGAAIVDRAGNISKYIRTDKPGQFSGNIYNPDGHHFDGFTLGIKFITGNAYPNVIKTGANKLAIGDYTDGSKLYRHQVTIDLDKPSSYFGYTSWQADYEQIVSYYDTKGSLIETKTYPRTTVNDEIHYYTAPSGVKIDKIIIDYKDKAGTRFGELKYETGSVWEAPTVQTVDDYQGDFTGTSVDNIFNLPDAYAFTQGKADINGNGGIDTLRLTGANQELDFSKLTGRIHSVEILDITGSGDNTVKLSLGDVLEQGGKDLFVTDGKTQMMIKGNAGDKVQLSDILPSGSDVGDWKQASGTVQVGGVTYNIYQHSGLDAELLVQQGVQTDLQNH